MDIVDKERAGRSLAADNGGYAQLASDVLAHAKQCGASEADIVVADGETFSVQVRVGAVDRFFELLPIDRALRRSSAATTRFCSIRDRSRVRRETE